MDDDAVPAIDTHLRLLHAVVRRRHFADRQHCAILVAEITAALLAKRDAIPALPPCDRWGLTPLGLAAYSGDVQLVRQLFDMYDDTPATVLRMLPWRKTTYDGLPTQRMLGLTFLVTFCEDVPQLILQFAYIFHGAALLGIGPLDDPLPLLSAHKGLIECVQSDHLRESYLQGMLRLRRPK